MTCGTTLVVFELLAQDIIRAIVLLRLGMPLLVVEPKPSAADWAVPAFANVVC